MTHNPQHIERRTLLISTYACLLIGLAGIGAYVLSDSQAIMLDGLFNLIYFLTGLLALKVSKLVQRGDDDRFPYGYAFFEPLTNGIKGLLVSGISIVAVLDAINALLSEGRAIAADIAIAYGVFASVICWTLAAITHRGFKRSQSPLVHADAQNWLVNGAISSSVMLVFITIPFIHGTAYENVIPYLDPALVLLVMLISISIPIRMAWKAILELLNRAPPAAVINEVSATIKDCLKDLPIEALYVRIVQPGRTRLIVAHAVLPTDYAFEGLMQLDTYRADTLQALQAQHDHVVLDIIFTADKKWGAPVGAAEAGIN